MKEMNMIRLLRQLNRRRLFSRNERKRNVLAARAVQNLSESEKQQVKKTLNRLKPYDCKKRMIRIGPNLDGGYVLPDDLEDVTALFSPGVDESIGFDLAISKRGIPCFLADGTVERPRNLRANMKFEKKMIGNGPENSHIEMEDWVSGSVPKDGDLMLQMDIEGAEVEVLAQVSDELLNRFRIIVIELHDIDVELLGPHRVKYDKFVQRLTEDHLICHLHPNTVAAPVNVLGYHVPPLIELTLLRKDRVETPIEATAQYPHPLDCPNDANHPHRNFPAFW